MVKYFKSNSIRSSTPTILPSALLPSRIRMVSDPRRRPGLAYTPQAVCALQRRDAEMIERWFRRVARGEMRKRVLVMCLFFLFWFGKNVATGRGGEGLEKVLDKNGNARLGWCSRRLHVAALPYPTDYPTSSSFSFKDQEFGPS